MTRCHTPSERAQLDLFRTLPGKFAPRDAQDLMAYPFFSLSKTHRGAPIDYQAGNVSIRVEAVPEHGMATIWDADILIWAGSQIVEARDGGLRTSRCMAATPYEILKFTGRGTSLRDYLRLKAALDRLQSTTVCTSIRQSMAERRHRFSWVNEWQERLNGHGKADGIELVLPDWFYQAVLDDALVLTIDRAYFALTGGLERWLYRIVRKHGGRQRRGWSFEFRHLHLKSGSLSPYKRFAFELRDIIRRQPLPGYDLSIEVDRRGHSLLSFETISPCGQAVDGLVLSGTGSDVPSRTRHSCHQEPKQDLTHCKIFENRALNLDSNKESNFLECAREGENPEAGVPEAANLSSPGCTGSAVRRPGACTASRRSASVLLQRARS
ncbi:replication protein [Labrys sp. WJW]|uniref:replication initiator protein A n=1 Tax=Labrys sp. WJW TaxID=1737983 RepID=UPI000835A616|nr:replication initiator protein A [Labrys sp. WJW]OCC05395.1 replication protein [Labrys sp. WJW]